MKAIFVFVVFIFIFPANVFAVAPSISGPSAVNLVPIILISIGIVFLLLCVIVVSYPYIKAYIAKKMNNEKIYLTNNSDETQKLGIDFAKNLKYGNFLAFYGNLGGGKTTFIQGLAKGLGIKRRIISPTFIIVRHYRLDKGSFYHIDLYRTENKHDLLGLGIDEIIEDKDNIIAVEWSDKLDTFLPKKRIELHFKYIDDNKREITIKKYE